MGKRVSFVHGRAGAATDDNRITKFVRVGRGLWRSRSPTPPVVGFPRCGNLLPASGRRRGVGFVVQLCQRHLVWKREGSSGAG